MGLGKTAQALAAITHLHNTEAVKHFLVICPASIIHNWHREISRCNELQPWILHGSLLFHNFRMWKDVGGIAVTSYDAYRSKVERLYSESSVRVAFLVVDEAHYIKNREAKRTMAVLKTIPNCARAVFMTGTPLENRVAEFIHLIRTCNQNLADSISLLSADLLGQKLFEKNIAPVYLRRNQEDVLKDLPECIETEEWVEFSDQERARYIAAVRKAPYLMTMRRAVFGAPYPSAKLNRVQELISHYRDEGRKIVVFSFFLDALQQIEGACKGNPVFRISGSVPSAQRIPVIDAFSRGNSFSVMLCQIEAGGVGINLHAASAAILVEPQFKPSTEQQAIKRLHRMGQSRSVRVHRLLAHDTIDEDLRELVHKKSKIFDAYARNSAIKNASQAAAAPELATVKKFLHKKGLERIGAVGQYRPGISATSVPNASASRC